MTLKSLAIMTAILSTNVAPALAQAVNSCDSYIANAAFLVFPPAETTAEYADGAVRLITLDTAGEPACCSYHLMVLYPSSDGSYLECSLVSSTVDYGYYSIFVNQAQVLRDDAEAVSLMVPTEGNVDGEVIPAAMRIDVDLAAGTLAASAP
ncbi:MAG: hypothetical protein B7Z38_07065 [Rhodobacterales bacterium 12-64-8]|nr:MAG: hypothetical protein B7Z38_07065 [Rhodobacterales bacterium 12-64-8]